MKTHITFAALALGALSLASSLGLAQTDSQAHPQTDAPPPAPQEAPPPPKGQVLFQSHGEPPASGAPDPKRPQLTANPSAIPTGPELTDREREAITFAAYDLDARLTPTASRLAMRARVTLRNDGDTPLDRIALQISSALTWESASLKAASGNARLVLAQHLLDTDADHTGKASEAIITLPRPLLPGNEITLDTFYSGAITANAERLERIGATHEQALATDWDAIDAEATSLRGMGNVLWYPVASRQLFLGDGAQLFDAIGAMKRREAGAIIHLRLSVEYAGDPPTAAYFCGRRKAFTALSDAVDAPIASGTGLATAEFSAEPLGFRMPSLFVVERPETLLAPLPAFTGAAPGNETDANSSSSSSNASAASPAPPTTAEDAGSGVPMLAVEASDDSSLPRLADSAERLAPLLEEWLGPQPLSALTILDQPGQPFEDGPLLFAPVAGMAAPSASEALLHSLTHAWVQTGQPWMDEGLAQFFALLWTEREKGRDAAIAQLSELMQPVAIAEPAITPGEPAPPGQPLVAATSELYFRRKAAAMWWMLRGVAGDEPLQAALRAWRVREPGHDTPEQDALGFETLLEKTSGKDLHWFFDDWVLHDRGLPDLSITEVTPRELPAGKGHNTGWLVAVSIRNDGAAAVEVPVVIRSKSFSTTSRLRISGFSSATARVLVEAAPTEVLVNDGGTPEVRASVHQRTIAAPADESQP